MDATEYLIPTIRNYFKRNYLEDGTNRIQIDQPTPKGILFGELEIFASVKNLTHYTYEYMISDESSVEIHSIESNMDFLDKNGDMIEQAEITPERLKDFIA